MLTKIRVNVQQNPGIFLIEPKVHALWLPAIDRDQT